MKELKLEKSVTSIWVNGHVRYEDDVQIKCWLSIKEALTALTRKEGSRWRAIETWLREQQEEE